MSKNVLTKSLLDGGGCPAGYGHIKNDTDKEKASSNEPEKISEQDGINLMVEKNGLSYGDYLQLDKILTAQTCQSELHGELVHDEHLFIVIHQVYELWFKQVIFEIDSIRTVFMNKKIEEAEMLEVNKRLQRVVMIVKLLADQVLILETMTPLDFMDFRDHLSTASGFQSLQFRLVENKLGVKSEHRVRYNQNNYREVYESKEKEIEALNKSEEDPSLFDLIDRWLQRTPGLDVHDNFSFSTKYEGAINKVLADTLRDIEAEQNSSVREVLLSSYKKKKEQYSTIFDKEKHNSLIARGERRFSFEAMHGALMISLYREEPLFHLPHQILSSLMDIDSLITKWRYNHVMLVQRMLGSSNIGTGGSSGYHYLRSTLSERYKVFLDLFNLSTFLIPRGSLPPLTKEMKRALESWRDNIK